jgi:SAM-dependent methyltransferase
MLAMSSFSFIIGVEAIQLKEHERWWTVNMGSQLEIFHNWLGDEDAPSRVRAREHIKQKGYMSVLDIPCGLCTEYLGYQKEKSPIAYFGMDITEGLVSRAKKLGVPAFQGNIEMIPCPDSIVDVCYARHILEHLSGYKLALTELIRVAREEVIVVFFMLPGQEEDFINLTWCDGCRVYHNIYNKNGLDEFIRQNKKVKNTDWESVGSGETAESILHIYLNDKSD